MAVVGHQIGNEVTVLIIELEGVSETDAFEWHVIAAGSTMIGGLDVDRGDVVGQQNDLIGVNLVPVFVLQFVRLNEPGLKQAGDEGPRTGKGVQNMDALAAKGLTKF